MMTRIEHDLLGDRAVPETAYYGVHTLRAIENFPITGTPISIYPDLIIALAWIKEAAAKANHDLGVLSLERSKAIVEACHLIRDGKYHREFVVDVIQGGAGTSTNMNANEVIANVALELLGKNKGDYATLHPNEHVNLSQSTNDVYPTAIKLALVTGIRRLQAAMSVLRQSFERKADEFDGIMKIGRTQLQDAVPMTLGQEFSTYAVMLGEDEARLGEAALLLQEINLGATAIGTGINTHPSYAGLVRHHLSKITGRELITASNLVEATQDAGAFVQLSGVLKRVAVKLSKTCNDLRLLSSGPRGGFGEINLPPVQAGSSIMPGKVNPVIPEMVNQVAFEVIGNDVTVSFAAEAGQLQLNAFEPIIAYSLFSSLNHMERACLVLAEKCVNGITANVDRLAEIVEQSLAIVTALNPHIGYENATRVAMMAHGTGKTVRQTVLELGLMAEGPLDAAIDVSTMVRPQALTG
ncbi:MAG: aspartate ammonia-lyase [Pseudomonadota bacterium]|jgi:aspartate ammonia-lyase